MQRDDLLVSLGDVSASTPDTLRAVAALVGRSEGSALPVVVTREGDRLELVLTPRSGWGGRGLLGCVRARSSSLCRLLARSPSGQPTTCFRWTLD